MLSKDLKRALKLSGGKLIVSDGNLDDSYVVMKLEDFLDEKEKKDNEISFEEPDFGQDDSTEENIEENFFDWSSNDEEDDQFGSREDLTDKELLGRINADIAKLKERQTNEDVMDTFEFDNEENPDEIKYQTL